MFSKIVFQLSPIVSLRIKGNSMSPVLKDAEKVLVIKYWFGFPQKKDIVLLKHPFTSQLLVKRLEKINRRAYWVEGDNKKESTDSRDFGWIEKKNIIGKVLVKHS